MRLKLMNPQSQEHCYVKFGLGQTPESFGATSHGSLHSFIFLLKQKNLFIQISKG